jgi:hypothetical protein
MRRGPVDGTDNFRELRKLFGELLSTAPGAARLASAAPDFRPLLRKSRRVSHEARLAATTSGDLIRSVAWATSVTFRLGRALARSSRR